MLMAYVEIARFYEIDQCPDLEDSYLQAEETGGVSEMRLVSMQKNVAMWDEHFTEHAKTRHAHLHTFKYMTKNKSVYAGKFHYIVSTVNISQACTNCKMR